jgi:uncharacterized membrane protein
VSTDVHPRGGEAPPDGLADDLADDLDDLPEVPRRLALGVGWVLLVGGLVGAVTALVLLVEKLRLLTDPGYVPSCSIDPVLSCGSIMRTAQASVLGFPNPVIGLATFPVVAALGALVLGRVELPRWTWLALQFGATAGLGFVLWLMGESLLVIHALCPYCMVVWAAVIPLFWYTTVHNMAAGHLGGGRVAAALVRRHGVVLAAAYLAVVVAVVAAFPGYWASVVGL